MKRGAVNVGQDGRRERYMAVDIPTGRIRVKLNCLSAQTPAALRSKAQGWRGANPG